MKQFFFIHFFIILFFPAKSQSIADNDLSIIVGKWTGKLTYLDYTSNKQDGLNADLKVERKSKDHFEFSFYYGSESSHNSTDKYVITGGGHFINDMKVIERSEPGDGSIKLVLENTGTDGNDNKPAVFHHIFSLSDKKFSLTRMVKYFGNGDFFQRNQFVFTR